MTGVHAVLTSEDLSGMPLYGLEHPDQPVLADGVVRYQGEPIAIVAADHPENARLALEAIEVEYELIEPLSDSELAQENEARHPDGNLFREINLSYGNSQEEEEGEHQPEAGVRAGITFKRPFNRKTYICIGYVSDFYLFFSFFYIPAIEFL